MQNHTLWAAVLMRHPAFTCACCMLCMQMPTEMGGGAGKVAFIDTEGTFRPERIRPIAQRFNLDVDAVLENASALNGNLLLLVRLAFMFDQLSRWMM